MASRLVVVCSPRLNEGTGVRQSGLATKILALTRTGREQAATNVLGEFRQVVGSHANELDTDVSVPAPPAPPQPQKKAEDEDFSEKPLYRKESW